jgi:hypothetical protein
MTEQVIDLLPEYRHEGARARLEIRAPQPSAVKGVRRRSTWFYMARKQLSRTEDLGREELDTDILVTYFENWMEKYHDKFIRLQKDERWIFIRCINRFTEPYRNKLKKRARKLRKFRFDLKIELTLDPKKFFTLKDEFDFLPPAWNKLRSWFIKRYGKMEYLRILEIQKKGRPHLHILFSFYDDDSASYFKSFSREDKYHKRFMAFYNDLKAEWGKIGGGHIWVKPVKGNLKLVNYVLKYVNKTLDPSALKDRTYCALLFASNKRLFSISKGFQVFAGKNQEKQGYEYMGTVEATYVRELCQGKGLMFCDYVATIVVTEDYYEYATLFELYDYG